MCIVFRTKHCKGKAFSPLYVRVAVFFYYICTLSK